MRKELYNEITKHLYVATLANFDRAVKKIRYQLREVGYDEETIKKYIDSRILRV